ncbi:MAG: GIY-YIG nuclease family protein [Candidatus Kapaibacterium sp.]
MKRSIVSSGWQKRSFFFDEGYYIYAGSALKNAPSRIKRHFSNEKKLKWHIDFLLNNELSELKKAFIIECNESLECTLNSIVQKSRHFAAAYKGFGSSDCKVCYSHLSRYTSDSDINIIIPELLSPFPFLAFAE